MAPLVSKDLPVDARGYRAGRGHAVVLAQGLLGDASGAVCCLAAAVVDAGDGVQRGGILPETRSRRPLGICMSYAMGLCTLLLVMSGGR